MYLFIIYTCKPQGEPARPLARTPALQPPSHEAKHSSSLARWSSLGIHLTVCGVPALPARRRRELVILVAAVLLVGSIILIPWS